VIQTAKLSMSTKKHHVPLAVDGHRFPTAYEGFLKKNFTQHMHNVQRASTTLIPVASARISLQY